MAIAALFNVPGTPEETATWAFAHAAHHRDINAAIYRLVGISLPEFVLDPLNPNDMGPWIYQHQSMHNNQNSLLSIEGFDLTDVDWKDQNQLAGFCFLNAVEHREAGTILSIG